MKVVFTAGVFDLLHWGHFELFRRSKALVESDGRLIVAVQRDEVVEKYKPGTKLCYDWSMRTKMIKAIRYVDEVVPYDDIDKSIKRFKFDIFVIGGDQVHAGFQEAVRWCLDNGKEVVRLNRTEGVSSTQMRNGNI